MYSARVVLFHILSWNNLELKQIYLGFNATNLHKEQTTCNLTFILIIYKKIVFKYPAFSSLNHQIIFKNVIKTHRIIPGRMQSEEGNILCNFCVNHSK